MPTLTEAAYLAELTARAARVLGDALVGVYAGGSWALGDYLPGRSDLDVAIVCAQPLDEALIDEVAARDVAGSGGAEPGFELNLNTGARMPRRLERHGGTTEAHWYALDRSLLAAYGVALSGPAAAEVFRSPPRTVVLDLMGRSLRWHEGGDAAPDDAVLNAARSLVYAREGRWTSKPAAARRLIERGERVGLMGAAVAAREGRGAPLEEAAVRAFIRDAARQG